MVSWITREEIDIIVAKAVAAERERCAAVAADWFTLAPKYRTKERLLAAIREGE